MRNCSSSGCRAQEYRVSGSEAVIRKMEEQQAVLQQELAQEVEVLSKNRRIEDRATRMAKEAEVKKV